MIGPGSFYTSLMPIFLVRGAPEAIRAVTGPIVLVTNLLTEGRGMWDFTAGEAVRRMSDVHRPADRRRDRQHARRRRQRRSTRYLAEHKRPLELGDIPATCEVVDGRVLVRRDRAPRSPPPRAGGLGGAREAAALVDTIMGTRGLDATLDRGIVRGVDGSGGSRRRLGTAVDP